MAAFAYRAYGESGAESGVIEAASRDEASRLLAQARKKPFALSEVDRRRPAPEAGPTFAWTPFRRPDRLDKILTELSVLLDAGFNVAAALRVIAAAQAAGVDRERLQAISEKIADGKSLSEAFASWPGLTPDVSAMIASGEQSGRIAQVVSRMAEGFRYRAERRAAIRDALVYPAFLLLMVIAAFLFLALYLMPAIEPVFDTGSMEKPVVVWMLSGVGRFLNENGGLLLGIGLAIAALVGLASRGAAARRLGSRLVLRLPVVGRLRRQAAIVKFLDALSLMSGNGVALIEALRLAAWTCSMPELRGQLDQIGPRVADGVRLQTAFKQAGVFDGPTLTLVGIGEESNNLAPLLKRASTLVETRLKTSIDRIATFLTPAITIGLGLLIGGLVVSVMTALLSINQIAIQ